MSKEYKKDVTEQGSVFSPLMVMAYNPHQHGDQYIDGVIDCYQKSFAGLPWNESHVCGDCGKVLGETEVQQLLHFPHCPACHGLLAPYWPHHTVKSDFLEETTEDEKKKKFVSSWIAVLGGRVVGICWGYTLSPEALAEKVELPHLAQCIYEHFGSDTSLISYQDELAVVPEYRGVKFSGTSIARALVEARHRDFLKFGARVGIVRTLREPATITYQWYTKIGFTQIASYENNEHRVILGRRYDDLRY